MPKNKNTKGFTMAELVLVFAIMAVIAGLAIPNFGQQRNRLQFNQAMTNVLNVINTARNYAVSSRAYFDGNNSLIPKEGYGVYIERGNDETGTLTLFANIGNDPNRYDLNGNGDDAIEKTFSLPNVAPFKKLTLISSAGVSDSNFDNAVIIFRPPLAKATVAVNGDPFGNGSATAMKTVEMNFLNPDTPDFVPAKIRFNEISGFAEYFPPQPQP